MPWEQPCLQASIVESSGYLLDPHPLWIPTPHLRSLLTLDSFSHTVVFGASRFRPRYIVRPTLAQRSTTTRLPE
ncbi:unnamed protein product [Fusarium graminearum]|uniref:Uncharacterized protein n=1 Tax=Gibberella zeae TaxID=5518 RepID=A0A9N8R609_GIBZA|nr:unnamed protein product [Fusarium graminearum]